MPSRTELAKHERDKVAFFKQMQIASQQFRQIVFEECLQIADDASGDYRRRVGRNGKDKEPELDIGSIQRSKVRIDTRMKLLRILDAERYSDKKPSNGKGAGQPAKAVEPGKQLSDIELARRAAFVLEKGRRSVVASGSKRAEVTVGAVSMPVMPVVMNGSTVHDIEGLL